MPVRRQLAITAVVVAWAVLASSQTSMTQVPPDVRLAPAPRVTDTRQVTPTVSPGSRAALTVDPSNRSAVADFFNSVYVPALAVPAGWTGSVATCVPGVTSAAYIAATINMVNFYRAMARLPADVENDPALDAKAQQAALMMAAQVDLSHTPPPGWACFTADGAEAALKSNLALGAAGATAVTLYGADEGVAGLGHRRWIVFPPLASVGTGSTDTGGTAVRNHRSRANALWVVGTGGPRPATPEQVAWPPTGFVPFQVVYPSWSFAVNTAAAVDFSTATVTMTQGNAAVPLTMEPIVSGFGDETISWQPTLPPLQAGMADATFTVTVTNVTVGGAARTFTYDVTVFDPATGSPGPPPAPPGAPLVLNPVTVTNWVAEFTWTGGTPPYTVHFQNAPSPAAGTVAGDVPGGNASPSTLAVTCADQAGALAQKTWWVKVRDGNGVESNEVQVVLTEAPLGPACVPIVDPYAHDR